MCPLAWSAKATSSPLLVRLIQLDAGGRPFAPDGESNQADNQGDLSRCRLGREPSSNSYSRSNITIKALEKDYISHYYHMKTCIL